MNPAKVFQSGNSQAIRLPKEFRFDTNEVVISKVGDGIMVMPRTHSKSDLMQLLTAIGPLDISRDQQPEEQDRVLL